MERQTAWLEEVSPVLREYAEGSAEPVLQAIEDARSKRIEADLDQFLAGAPCIGVKGSHRSLRLDRRQHLERQQHP